MDLGAAAANKDQDRHLRPSDAWVGDTENKKVQDGTSTERTRPEDRACERQDEGEAGKAEAEARSLRKSGMGYVAKL